MDFNLTSLYILHFLINSEATFLDHHLANCYIYLYIGVINLFLPSNKALH